MKRKIQLVLAVAIAIAAVRAGYILYERHPESPEPVKKPATSLQADYYVTPRRLHPYDVKSAHELTQQPVWVKEGYRYTFFPYDATRKRADFQHPAGTLFPIEKLQIKDVTLDQSGDRSQHLLMASFEKDGHTYAVQIGVEKDGNFQIYSDEIFYIQNPRELYGHWPADVWDAVEKHEVKAGMNELQADFAIGMGIAEASGNSDVKTVNYPNAGKPVSITYREGKAAEIKTGPAGP